MECVWHRASLRAVCAALTCSAMDLQVVVWLFYCLLLPSGLLTGKLKEKQLHWCQQSGSQRVRARRRDALGVRQGVKTLHKFDRSRTGRDISTYFRGVRRNSHPACHTAAELSAPEFGSKVSLLRVHEHELFSKALMWKTQVHIR